MADSEQSQSAGDGSTLIQAGGNITLAMPYPHLRQMVEDLVNANLAKIWTLAQNIRRDAGLPFAAIPLKVIARIVRYASLEDDEYLQEHWAVLLANSSDDDAHASIYPSFADILSTLSRSDAKLLSKIFDTTCRRMDRRPSQDSYRNRLYDIDIGDWRELITMFCEADLAKCGFRTMAIGILN